jgi:hypothetical protein
MLKNVMNQMFNMASVPCLYPQGLALYDLSNTGKDLTLTLYRVRVSYKIQLQSIWLLQIITNEYPSREYKQRSVATHALHDKQKHVANTREAGLPGCTRVANRKHACISLCDQYPV